MSIALRAIQAAAVRLDDYTDAKGELARTMTRYEKWQELALGFYDTIGEVHYGVTQAADALAKGKLFVGVRDNPDDPLIPVDDPESGVNPRLAEIATTKLRELKAPVGGQAQIIRMAAINKRIAGEWFLLHYPGPDPRLIGWHVRSVDDIKIGEDKVTSKGLGEFTFDEVSRVWQPHPRRFEAADCGMRGVLGACETVLLCDHQFRAGLRSRLFRGLLLLSNGFRRETLDDGSETAGNGEAADDPLVNDLVEALALGIQQEGTASAMVPNILYGRTEDVKDGHALIDFGQQVDPAVMDLRTDSIRRIAQGIDEPAEIITGMGDINHWGQWFIGESFVQHIEPEAEFLADALTSVFLRPELEADGFEDTELLGRLEVGMDLSALMRRPNGDQDARDAYDRGEISGAGLRKALGIGEEWAPEELDTLRWLALKATPGPNLLETLIRMVVAPDLAPVAIDQPAPNVTPMPQTEPDGPPIAAAAGASSLLDIDRAITERLYAALISTFKRALEKAGNRARARVAASFRPRAIDVPAEQVVAHVGPAVLAAAQVTEDELLSGAMEQLRPDFDRWVRDAAEAALLAALLIAAQNSDDDVDPAAVEEFRARQAADRQAAWEWLSAAGAAVLAEHMHSGRPISDWEARALARQSLSRAGGTDTLASTANGESAETVPQGAGMGLATGAAIIGLLGEMGSKPTGWEWVHGEPDHPYPDHVDLNGQVEEREDDFGGFYPGDHDGCTCELQPVFGGTE